MENKKVAFITLGCKVNQYETNAMCEKFINKGYEVVEKEEKADILEHVREKLADRCVDDYLEKLKYY